MLACAASRHRSSHVVTHGRAALGLQPVATLRCAAVTRDTWAIIATIVAIGSLLAVLWGIVIHQNAEMNARIGASMDRAR